MGQAQLKINVSTQKVETKRALRAALWNFLGCFLFKEGPKSGIFRKKFVLIKKTKLGNYVFDIVVCDE